MKKKVVFTKKIDENGLLKKEINAFQVCVVCGYCGKTDRFLAEISNPKEYGWIFFDKEDEIIVAKGGAWFCSLKCKVKQVKQWKKQKRSIFSKATRTHSIHNYSLVNCLYSKHICFFRNMRTSNPWMDSCITSSNNTLN